MKLLHRGKEKCFKLLYLCLLLAPSTLALTTNAKNGTRTGGLSALDKLALIENKLAESETKQLLKLYNGTSRGENDELQDSASTISGKSSRSPQPREEQEAAPSVTSVHQVWTSTSSGSLDELSPELISKLRQDVPFLAAYALRPRLVGANSADSQATGQPKREEQRSSQLLASEANSQPVRAVSRSRLQTTNGESENLVPKLGDFSEFNVETSSISKSEHQHNRRTVLRRKPMVGDGNSNNEAKNQRRSLVAAANQLKMMRRRTNGQPIARKLPTKANGRRSSKATNGVERRERHRHQRPGATRRKHQASKQRSRNVKRLPGSQAGRLRRKLDQRNLLYHMNIIRHGRYQAAASENSDGGAGVELMRDQVATRGERAQAPNSKTADGGVKGGSSSAQGKRPFYSKAKPAEANNVDGDDDAENGKTNVASGKGERTRGGDIDDGTVNGIENDNAPPIAHDGQEDPKVSPAAANGGKDQDEGAGNEDEPLDDEPVVAKRVGDPDVEEEGDTVAVMPKSDGVDDDPELPESLPDDEADNSPRSPDADQEGGGADERVEGKKGRDGAADEDEERGRRVGRDRENGPNSLGLPGEAANGGATTLGGGISATTGGFGGGARSEGGNEDDESNNDDRPRGRQPGDDETTLSEAANSSGKRPSDGGEPDEVDRERDEEEASPGRPSMSDSTGDKRPGSGFESDSRGPPGETGGTTGSDEPEAVGEAGGEPGSFSPDSRRFQGGSKRRDEDPTTGAPSPADETTTGKRPDDFSGEGDGDLDYRDEMEAERRQKDGRAEESGKRKDSGDSSAMKSGKGAHGKGAHGKDCDDGQYDAHGDHHHHDHHNSIEWLRGAIPGEPGVDYPTLGRVNTTTDFNCRDQKYPGYYADVEARCQVFHICQMDGRQDSFLCPNGTIFSQITSVCVWWNSFDCEDAPKYYGLNALLYKAPSSSASEGSLRPLDGAAARRGDGSSYDAGSDAEESPIDGLIKAMRGPKNTLDAADTGARRNQAGVTYEANDYSGSDTGPRRNMMAMMDNVRPADDPDEATIQKKSINIDDEPSSFAAGSSASRLKAKERRKRRASVRQAPPKLKSRRVSRNSRRRKLRHGIKPKRRA